jgi:HlyD family secretion protein
MGDDSFVTIQDDSGMTKRQKVEIGITDDAIIEIISGLSAGDKVLSTSSVSSGSSEDEDGGDSGSLLQMGGGGRNGGGQGGPPPGM